MEAVASSPAWRSPTRPSASSGSAGSACWSPSGWPPSASPLIAYDPYIQPARAAAARRPAGRRWTSCCRESDFITIHLPKTPETLGLIGAAELATVKPRRDHRQRRPRWADRRAALADALTVRPGGAAPASTCTPRSRSHRQPAVRAAEHRRDPAPGRVHDRGAGQGRHRGRPVGAAGAAGRVRAGRGQRAGRRRRRRGRAARAPAGARSSAGSSPRSPAGCAAVGDRRGARRAGRSRRLGAAAGRRSRASSPTSIEEQVTYVNAPAARRSSAAWR